MPVNRWIVVPEIVQHFDVDEYVGDDERRQPESSRATCFDEDSRTKMERREGDESDSATD